MDLITMREHYGTVIFDARENKRESCIEGQPPSAIAKAHTIK
ncbi:MAG: hypothetical protein QW291_09670 [Thermofilaceae archaeon]